MNNKQTVAAAALGDKWIQKLKNLSMKIRIKRFRKLVSNVPTFSAKFQSFGFTWKENFWEQRRPVCKFVIKHEIYAAHFLRCFRMFRISTIDQPLRIIDDAETEGKARHKTHTRIHTVNRRPHFLRLISNSFLWIIFLSKMKKMRTTGRLQKLYYTESFLP